MITKITKQEFKRELVTHKSYFAGVLNSILEDQILSAYYKFGKNFKFPLICGCFFDYMNKREACRMRFLTFFEKKHIIFF